MNLTFTDLFDPKELQSLMNSSTILTGIPIEIIGIGGEVLISACSNDDFSESHRFNPASFKDRLEASDGFSENPDSMLNGFIDYKSQNGLNYEAKHIYSGEEHIAELVLGPFLIEDEVFATGFEENTYTVAMKAIPKISREKLNGIKSFFAGLIESIANQGLKILKSNQEYAEKLIVREEFQKNRERYVLAMFATETGVWDWNFKTGDYYYSPLWFQMLGYEPEDFEHGYDLWHDLIHPDDIYNAENSIKDNIEKSLNFDLEYRMRSYNGEWIWIQSKGKVISRDGIGAAERIIGTHTNINEKKRLENAYKRSVAELELNNIELLKSKKAIEEKMFALTQPSEDLDGLKLNDLLNIDTLQEIQDAFCDATGVASIITDTKGMPITKASNFCRMCKDIIRKTDKGLANCMKSDGEIGKPDSKGPRLQKCLSGNLWDAGASIMIGDKHIANWLIGQVLDSEPDLDRMREYAVEIGAEPDDMIEAIKEVTIMPLDKFKKITRALYLIANQISLLAMQNLQQAREILKRTEAEKKLIESQERLTKIIDTCPDVVCITDLRGILTFVSNKSLDIFKFASTESAIGTNVISWLHPDDMERGKANVAHTIRGDKVSNNQYRLLKSDGSVFIGEINSSPLYDGKNIVGMLSMIRDITKRKEIENEIRKNNILLNSLVESSWETAIYSLDNELRYTFLNNFHRVSYKKIWDVDLSIGMGMLESIPDETTRDRVSGYFDRALRGENINVIDIIDVGDRQRYLEVDFNPIKDEEDKITGITVFSKNITAKIKLEEQMQKQDQLFRFAVNQLPGILWLVDKDLNLTMSAGKMLDNLDDYRKNEVDQNVIDSRGRSYFDYNAIEMHKRAIAGESVAYEDVVNNFNMEVHLEPFFDTSGEINGVIGFAIDVTERKKSMQALKYSEDRFRQVIEKTPVPMCIIDEEGILEYVNSAFTQLMKYSSDDLIGKGMINLLPRSGHEAGLEHHRLLLEKGLETTGEWTMIDKDKRKHSVISHSTRIFGLDGRYKQAAFILDITAMKKSESDMKKLLDDMETKNSEMERFTYTVSHDLRSPLITIKGFLGMLVSDAVSGNIVRMESDIKRISNAADKMQALLEDLLELSRIGRVVNSPKEFSMNFVCSEVIELLHIPIADKNVIVKIMPGMPKVIGDQPRIFEVVQNLVENAIKFMDHKEEKIIEIGFEFDENKVGRFFIKDNGIGIDKRYSEKIFGLFDKLNQKSEGTGIGLALVKRIIDLHKGEIWVESDGEGFGSTFYFTLPLKHIDRSQK